MDCMSTSPFESGSILKWFSSALSGELESSNVFPDNSVPASDSSNTPAPATSSSQVSTNIPVMIGAEVAELSVPIDLLCALLLTKSSTPSPSTHYTLEDIMEASENLKRFRDVASGSSTGPSSSTSSFPTRQATPILPTPPQQSPSTTAVDIIGLSLESSGAMVVQEMLTKANPIERDLIFSQVMENSLAVCVNAHGCRVIQRLLEFGTPDQNYRLFKSIPYYKIVDLCMDVNGNHVMQKFVEVLPQYALREVVDLVVADGLGVVARITLHSYGCRVIQRLLVKVSNPEDKAVLLAFIVELFPDLVTDQFGNYVAQHAIDYSTEVEKIAILDSLGALDILQLCSNKYASNVIEKAIRIRYTKTTAGSILLSLHKLIASIVHSEQGLLALMKDKYGNYVVKAICDLNPQDFPEVGYVKEVLLGHANVLKTYTYGFHLVEKIEKAGGARRERFGSGASSEGIGRSRGNSLQL
jgi:hypothetical protein